MTHAALRLAGTRAQKSPPGRASIDGGPVGFEVKKGQKLLITCVEAVDWLKKQQPLPVVYCNHHRPYI